MTDFGKDYQRFVSEYADEDPARLRLRYHNDPRSWLPLAINNIAALRKKSKFILPSGKDFTPAVIPFEVSAQQSTSAAVASLHADIATRYLPAQGARILDMTFGLGIDARFLSRLPGVTILGFDLKPELAEAAEVNFADTPSVEVRCGDSVEFLKDYTGDPFDLIFIDPARRGCNGERLYNLHDCQPDITELLSLFRKKSNCVIAKLSPMLDVTQTITDLPPITALHIVEEGSECKELLAILDFRASSATESNDTEPLITIDRLTHNGLQQFSFTRSEEREASRVESPALSGLPQPGSLILEPSAAAMKGAPFNLMAKRFGFIPFHPNSHLFLVPDNKSALLPSVPGTAWQAVKSWPLSSSIMKRMASQYPRADIAVRNLKGFTPDILRKKMKLKNGGPMRLLATTLSLSGSASPALIMTTPFDLPTKKSE